MAGITFQMKADQALFYRYSVLASFSGTSRPGTISDLSCQIQISQNGRILAERKAQKIEEHGSYLDASIIWITNEAMPGVLHFEIHCADSSGETVELNIRSDSPDANELFFKNPDDNTNYFTSENGKIDIVKNILITR